MAFLRPFCVRRTEIPKLFIFLTLPYGAVTCLSWRTLNEEDPGECVQGRPHQTMSSYFFCWVSSVDATMYNLAQEPASHQRHSAEIILIRPKCESELGALKGPEEKLKFQKIKGVLVFFEMPQLTSRHPPQCIGD